MPFVCVPDLEGPSLNYAVAKIEGFTITEDEKFGFWLEHSLLNPRCLAQYQPDRDAEIAHRIIEREGIATRRHSLGTWYAMMSSDLGDNKSAAWSEKTHKNAVRYGTRSYETAPRIVRYEGQSSLAAAMRCYVAANCIPELMGSKLVYRVDIPKALLEAA